MIEPPGTSASPWSDAARIAANPRPTMTTPTSVRRHQTAAGSRIGPALLIPVCPGHRGLRSREPGDGDAVRRAGHVVEPDGLAFPDRIRVAAVLAADPELEAGLRRAALVDRGLHQPGDRIVERLERVDRQDPVLDVLQEKSALGVVAAVAERHLGQVVRAEAEEVGLGR